MGASDRECCFFCAEPAGFDAQVCPRCRGNLLVDVRLSSAVRDDRVRYRIARSLASLGLQMPAFAALQRSLGDARPLVARAVTRAVAVRIANIVAPEGLTSSFAPVAGSAGRRGGGLGVALVAASVILVAVGLGALGWMGWRFVAAGAETRTEAQPALPTTATPVSLSTRELAAKSLPSTVSLRCPNSVASGFFVTPDTLMTNAHALCKGSGAVEVVLSDGQKKSGIPVQSDRQLDLALIKVPGANANPLPLGDAGETAVGDRVVLIGSPVGLEFTVHEGSISSLSRSLRGLAFIQIDAKVNPGNSGGPLLDNHGRVVGIVSLKHMGAEGIALALPINYAYLGGMVAAPRDVPPTRRFQEVMQARARSEEVKEPEAAPSESGVRLPMLVGATTDQYSRLVAHVLLVSREVPGYRLVAVKVWAGLDVVCTMKGDIYEWKEVDEHAPPLAVDQRMLPEIAKRSQGGRLFLGEAPLRFDLCPFDRMRGERIFLELEDADPELSRLQLRVRF